MRLYTFAGTILLAAARLYQGQTTNMRTPAADLLQSWRFARRSRVRNVSRAALNMVEDTLAVRANIFKAIRAWRVNEPVRSP